MRNRNKILIVDDRSENLFALESVLKPLDVEIIRAMSGHEALKATLHHDFSLAIIDVQMPGMDGYELASLMRVPGEDRGIPIIFLSAVFSDEAHIFRGYDSGAVDFITKPFLPEILLSKSKVFLALDRQKKDLLRHKNVLEKLVEKQRRINDHLHHEIAERAAMEIALQKAKEEAEQRGKAQERLAQAARELSLARDLETIMAVVRRAARELTGADGASFVLRDGDKCFYADEDAIEPLWKGQRFPMTTCISGWVMLHRQAAVIEDIFADPRIPADAYRPTFVKSLVMVPVQREAPIAAIGNYWATMRTPDPDTVRLLQSLADLASVAMENDRLYTELKHRAEELAAQKEVAESASRAKGDFLANMSHEIRTPLSGIIGLTQMTLHKFSHAEIREYLEMILGSSRSLLGIVNDILDFSKIEAGKMEFLPMDFDLRAVVERTMKAFQFSSRQKGLTLSVRIDPAVPEGLYGDPDRIMQVVRNLVSNALKFTDQGEVEVEFRLLQSGDPMLVACSVSDTGIGISEDRLSELFQAFSQLETSRAKRFAGTGLGLAISRQLVEMMGGTIAVESRPGQGSTFRFTVSLRPVQDTSREPVPVETVPSGGFAGLRVLLAEDNLVNRLFLKHFLVEAGCEVRLAGSGSEVLVILAQEPVDLVLMDIQMPEMDGTEATRRIRDSEVGDAVRSIPVVALTAFSMKGDRERFLSAGLDDYVSKPVDVEELFMVMRKVLDRTSCGNAMQR